MERALAGAGILSRAAPGRGILSRPPFERAESLPHFPEQAAVGTQDLAIRLAIRAGLLAADVQLGRAVDRT